MTWSTLRSASVEETRRFGQRVGQLAAAGTVVGLEGELGAGKTIFVKGMAAGLGLEPDQVSSPTFSILAEYTGGRLPLYHVDLYRLAGGDLDEIGLDEYVFNGGVAAIEWFGVLPVGFVGDCLTVSFSIDALDDRTLSLTARGKAHRDLLDRLFVGEPDYS